MRREHQRRQLFFEALEGRKLLAGASEDYGFDAFLRTHPVGSIFGPFDHLSIVIKPDEATAAKIDPDNDGDTDYNPLFAPDCVARIRPTPCEFVRLADGDLGMSIGAGVVIRGVFDDVLQADFNRPADIGVQEFAVELEIPSTYQSPLAFVNELVEKADTYGDDLEYSTLPERRFPIPAGYNSNSFIAGLMTVTGVTLPDGRIHPNDVFPGDQSYPGWPTRVPDKDFFETEAPVVERILVNGGGLQRSVVTSLEVRFDRQVIVISDAFRVRDRDTVALVDTTLVRGVINNKTVVTLTFSGLLTVPRAELASSLVDGHFELVVNTDRITWQGLNVLGDISGGNNIFGDRPKDAFFALFGDVNGDRRVNFVDFGPLSSAFGLGPDDSDYDLFWFLDFNGGGINFADFGAFSSRFGTRLIF